MKRIRFTLIASLALILVLSLAACGGSSNNTTTDSNVPDDDTPTESNEFRVGMECDYAPFNWTQTDETEGVVPISTGGYAGGYDVEIAKRIAEGLGKELVVVKIQWDGLIPALQSGIIDAVIAGMSPKEERKDAVDFSDIYYESTLVIVVREDSEYATATSLADFEGAKITGQLNTSHYTVIDQIPGVNKLNAMEAFPAMIVALQSGSIDGYVSELPGAVSAQAANPDLTFVEFEEGNGFVAEIEDAAVAVALKKGDPIVDRINEILSGISKEERERLMDEAVKNQPVVAE